MQTTRPKTYALVVVPVFAVLLNVMVWIAGTSRSGFWADDFLNLTSFNHSLGDLSNDHINKGKYIINVFWAIGTQAFGAGSVVPFLLLNSLIFAAGVGMWLRVGSRTRWSPIAGWWVAALFLATASWLPTALWSSNITHSCGFLALGLGLLSHERCIAARSAREGSLWSLLGGAAWTFALVSNLIYLGLLVIAAYCSYHQVTTLRRLGADRRRATIAVGSWNLAVPLIYFGAVAYPGTTSSSTYAESGLKYLHGDYDFYKFLLAPSAGLVVVYVVLVLLAVGISVAALRRGSYFAGAVLIAAAATAFPAFIQGQQRDIHYLAMPLLLIFSAVAAGLGPAGLGVEAARVRAKRASVALLAGATIALVLIFDQGASTRNFFVNTPYGAKLATFRSQVATLTPSAGVICARMMLDKPHQSLLYAELSGADGFLVPPIEAAEVFFLAPGERCPAAGAVGVTISTNLRGDFVAAR
jgi:hypothetical protein